MKLKTTPSSGNVFRDIGFASGEAEHLRVRADLLIKVQKLIETKKLTQTELAKSLRITRPQVGELLRGRIDLFSTDELIDILARLGVRVRLVLQPTRRGLKAA
jgi:predicted XRE-type DNA-binding protein